MYDLNFKQSTILIFVTLIIILRLGHDKLVTFFIKVILFVYYFNMVRSIVLLSVPEQK